MAQTLRDRASLISVTIHRWRPNVIDKAVSEEIEKNKNAQHAGKYTKILVPKEFMKEITSAETAIRENLHKHSEAWGDDGWRAMPGTLMQPFLSKHRALRHDFDGAVERFLNLYPTIVTDSRKRLGAMYNQGDYPRVTSLEDRFGIEINWNQIPDVADFRIACEKDMADEMRHEISETIGARQRDIVQGCWERMKEVLTKMHERISDENKTFRDSLIENVREQCDLLAHLNITDDPEIESMRQSVLTMLVPPQRLRDDKELRNGKAKEVEELLQRFTSR